MTTSRRREKRVLKLRKVDNKFLLEDSQEVIEDLLRRGFGARTERGILLDPIEVAYLASQKNRIIVDNVEVSENELLKQIPNFLKYVVYCDLRRRGYYVKPAETESPLDLLMWEKGRKAIEEPPRYGIKIVTEGLGIRAVELASILKYCESMGLQLVLALVSNDGVVTYYKTFSLKLERPLR